MSRSLEPKVIHKMMKININPLSCTVVSIRTLILLYRAKTRFIESKCLPTLLLDRKISRQVFSQLKITC